MTTLRTTVEIEHLASRGSRVALPDVLVDTSRMLSWLPREALNQLGIQADRSQLFQLPDGRVQRRDVGAVILHVAGRTTADDVVFADDTDVPMLGARSLSGLNLRIDPRSNQLVDAGPIVAALAVT